MVRTGITRAFGASLRRILAKSTSNRISAFFTGLGVTALLQSSTATCLIVTSFAARGFVPVAGAMAALLGADVGTTLVAQALSFDLSWLSPALLALGYALYQSTEDVKGRNIGRTLVGLGLMLLSLKLIVMASEPLRNSDILPNIVAHLEDEPILAVLIAAGITWLAHSSLAVVLLFMSFASMGTVSVHVALSFVLGANLGGTFTPLVMTLREAPAGRRVPMGNMLMRFLGALAVLPFTGQIQELLGLVNADPARMVVNFHTAFNLMLALVFLPIIGPLTRLSELLLPDQPHQEADNIPKYLDKSALETPPAALACAARETLRISDSIEIMLRKSYDAIKRNDMHIVGEIREKDNDVDALYGAVKHYLARLAGQTLDQKESQRFMQILSFSTNLEHIGDTIDKSLMDLATKKIEKQAHFSEAGEEEIRKVHARVLDSLQLAQNVFMSGDLGMARKLIEEKQVIRGQEITASSTHLARLREGVAETLATSSFHLDILRDLRRINSYLTSIAYPILEEAGQLHSSVLKKQDM